MLGWALVFLVVALIAGLLGFTGLAVASAGIAQILFYIFVVLFVVSSLIYLIRGRAPRWPFKSRTKSGSVFFSSGVLATSSFSLSTYVFWCLPW